MRLAMFTIGEFARLGGVSARMLRHYDAKGLLEPAAVDEDSGYRRYGAAQLATLNRIVALRDLGFGLQEIEQMLEEVGAEELRGMLVLRRAQIEREVAEDRDRLARIEARLRAIEGEDALADDVTIAALPEQWVATVSKPAAGLGPDNLLVPLREAGGELDAALRAANVESTGPGFAYYTGDPDDGDLVAHMAAPVDPSVRELPEPARLVSLPAVAEAAVVVRRGRVDEVFPAVYGELARWLDAHGHEPATAGRDAELEFDDETGIGVFRIQWPLHPRGRPVT